MMRLKRENRKQQIYSLRNDGPDPRTIIVEHPRQVGWEIVSDALPEETTPNRYRFRSVAEMLESEPFATLFETREVTRWTRTLREQSFWPGSPRLCSRW